MPDAVTIETKAEASGEAGIRIAGLDHVVLRVGDLDRAISFYQRVLGCRVERELQQPRLVQLRAGTALIDLVPASASRGGRQDRAQHGPFLRAARRLRCGGAEGASCRERR